MKTIKVIHTMYGYKGYIGADRVKDFGTNSEEWDAKEWLSLMLLSGDYKLSDKSDIKMVDVEAHRAQMAEPVRRQGEPAPVLTVTERTQAILDGWRGLPGEFYMLKGLICLDIAIEAAARGKTRNRRAIDAEGALLTQHFDKYMIVARIDELDAENRKGIRG